MMIGLPIEDMFIASLCIVQGKTTDNSHLKHILTINSLIISRTVVNEKINEINQSSTNIIYLYDDEYQPYSFPSTFTE